MLIVILLVTLIIIITLVAIDEEDVALATLLVFLIELLIMTCCIAGIVEGRVIDEKIAMYQEENEIIEKQIEVAVTNYMEYEQKTFSGCDSESAIVLVDLYPELKTDSLVSKQIEVYVENNKNIRDLMEDKIDISVYKWWVYFGR